MISVVANQIQIARKKFIMKGDTQNQFDVTFPVSIERMFMIKMKNKSFQFQPIMIRWRECETQDNNPMQTNGNWNRIKSQFDAFLVFVSVSSQFANELNISFFIIYNAFVLGGSIFTNTNTNASKFSANATNVLQMSQKSTNNFEYFRIQLTVWVSFINNNRSTGAECDYIWIFSNILAFANA